MRIIISNSILNIMKIALRTILFHFACIVVFAALYWYFAEHFESVDQTPVKIKRRFLDFLLFSTTIQAGVGISELYPTTNMTKITMIIQQLLMISTHVFTIYIFTL